MSIVKAKIEAKLVNRPDLERIKEAWKTSRPADIEPDMQKIMAMDVPVNEFTELHWEVKAPIAIRETICSLRNHVVWARSSRVENLTNWEVWDGLLDDQMKECIALHSRMKEEMTSKHQDDFRRLLPVGYMTTFSFVMSFRDFVKFTNALLKMVESGIAMNFAVTLIDKLKDDYFPAYHAIKHYAAYKPMALLPTFNSNETLHLGDYLQIAEIMPLSLRSQLIRHRSLLIRDGFIHFMKTENLGKPMCSLLETQIIMPVEFANELLEKRSCWIAQTDLWEPLLRQIRGLMKDISTVPPLPCKEGICPFKRDDDLRREGKDPSPPCPRRAQLDNLSYSVNQSEQALKYMAKRPYKTFWKAEIANAMKEERT